MVLTERELNLVDLDTKAPDLDAHCAHCKLEKSTDTYLKNKQEYIPDRLRHRKDQEIQHLGSMQEPQMEAQVVQDSPDPEPQPEIWFSCLEPEQEPQVW